MNPIVINWIIPCVIMKEKEISPKHLSSIDQGKTDDQLLLFHKRSLISVLLADFSEV